MLRVGNCILSGLGSLVGLLAGAIACALRGGTLGPLFLLGGCTFTGALLGSLLTIWIDQKQRHAVRRHFWALCNPDCYLRSAGSVTEFLPNLPRDSFWHELSQITVQAFNQLGRQAAQLQQSRAALEVKARRASEHSFQVQTVLNVLPLPVVMVNSHGEVLFANKAFAEQLGGEDAPAGKPVEQVLPEGPLCDMVLSALRRRLSSCRAEELELPVAGGQAVPFRCRLVPLWIAKPEGYNHGSLPRSSGRWQPGGRDLAVAAGLASAASDPFQDSDAPTESEVVNAPGTDSTGARLHAMDGGGEDGHRPSEERAAKFVGLGLILEPCPKLQQDRAQQAAFLSAVSHEMKTPLASIRAYAELLADGDAEDPATREEFFQVINTQVDRLQRLVQNLLDLARIEAGIMQVQKRTLSLNEILEEAAEVVRPTAAAKSLRLQTELSPLFLPVCVDRDLMLQAAINLLSNAIKYTPSGGQITLRSRLADDQVIFQVEDTGVGLTEEECARIFERFYRVKRNEKLAEGTGLGLALVKSIVEELHGGQISVESSVGKGTTFTVRLPAVHQAAAA